MDSLEEKLAVDFIGIQKNNNGEKIKEVYEAEMARWVLTKEGINASSYNNVRRYSRRKLCMVCYGQLTSLCSMT